MHEVGVKVVTIVDPYIKAAPGHRPFEKFLNCVLVTENDELYLARGGPGSPRFPTS